MNRNDPIQIDRYQEDSTTLRETGMRQQLRMSLFVVLVLLTATIGVMLSLSPAVEGTAYAARAVVTLAG